MKSNRPDGAPPLGALFEPATPQESELRLQEFIDWLEDAADVCDANAEAADGSQGREARLYNLGMAGAFRLAVVEFNRTMGRTARLRDSGKGLDAAEADEIERRG